MSIGQLEVQAGITDRAAFWARFARIGGTIRRGHLLLDAGFEAGVAELRRLVSEQATS